MVLGRLFEENLRRALAIARGDPWAILQRPITAGLVLAALLVLTAAILPAVRRGREEIFTE
jgi:putative tricarboxylic transport membrane protein